MGACLESTGPEAMRPRVTFLVCGRNCSEWIPRSLGLLRAQRDPVRRAVVVADASTDGSATLLGDWPRGGARFTVIDHKERAYGLRSRVEAGQPLVVHRGVKLYLGPSRPPHSCASSSRRPCTWAARVASGSSRLRIRSGSERGGGDWQRGMCSRIPRPWLKRECRASWSRSACDSRACHQVARPVLLICGPGCCRTDGSAVKIVRRSSHRLGHLRVHR